jgi:hypothetical protein
VTPGVGGSGHTDVDPEMPWCIGAMRVALDEFEDARTEFGLARLLTRAR